MESKLLVGGKTIVDHTNEQQRALEQRRREIAEQQVGVFIHLIFFLIMNCFFLFQMTANEKKQSCES